MCGGGGRPLFGFVLGTAMLGGLAWYNRCRKPEDGGWQSEDGGGISRVGIKRQTMGVGGGPLSAINILRALPAKLAHELLLT
jgi:hypothetical protein